MSAVPPVCAIADVLALWGCDGWFTPPLTPVLPPRATCVGKALTVQLRRTDNTSSAGLSLLYDLLSGDLAGAVIVVAGGATSSGAVWGEILSEAAIQSRVSGVIVDGWSRDQSQIAASRLVVASRGPRVVGPNGGVEVESIGEPIKVCRGIEVRPEDLVVIDRDGCIRIPREISKEVLEAASRYAVAEAEVMAKLSGGCPLTTAYRSKRAIVDELRRTGLPK
jgi:regulator of RNase E activity RraA